MDYAALKAEIALPAYAGMSDAEIAVALNAAVIDVAQNVEASVVRGDILADAEMAWGWVGVMATAPLLPSDPLAPVKALCLVVRDTLSLVVTLEATDEAKWTAMQAALNGLLLARQQTGIPLMSEALRDAVLARRMTKISRAAQLGLPPVDEQAVITARQV